MKKLEDFIWSILKYKFKNIAYLKEAFSHPSLKSDKINITYERLEFFGDSILSFVMANILFHQFPNKNEGYLSKKLMNLVCREKLYEIAIKLNIGSLIIMTKGEEKNNGRQNINSLADIIESLIAALFLDGGIEIVEKFIKKFWHDDLLRSKCVENSKTKLQEILQAQSIPLPHYEIIKKEIGKKNHTLFTVNLIIENVGKFFGRAASRKEAEIDAASKAINFLQKR